MAAGDVVNGHITAGSFQPAAGVEVLITSFCVNAADSTQYGLVGGGTAYNYVGGGNGTSQGSIMQNIKVFINNTNYLNNPSGTTAGYTGIQLK